MMTASPVWIVQVIDARRIWVGCFAIMSRCPRRAFKAPVTRPLSGAHELKAAVLRMLGCHKIHPVLADGYRMGTLRWHFCAIPVCALADWRRLRGRGRRGTRDTAKVTTVAHSGMMTASPVWIVQVIDARRIWVGCFAIMSRCPRRAFKAPVTRPLSGAHELKAAVLRMLGCHKIHPVLADGYRMRTLRWHFCAIAVCALADWRKASGVSSRCVVAFQPHLTR